MSIGKYQSENGLTGEASINFEITEAIFETLPHFESEDQSSSFIAIASIRVGHKYKKENHPFVDFHMYRGGNDLIAIQSIKSAMQIDPELRQVFQKALNELEDEGL